MVSVEDGKLILKGIRNPNFTGSIPSRTTPINRNHIWTGAVNSSKKMDFLYGRIDFRVRLETAWRAWPAVWLHPTDNVYGGNPNSGEVDLIEWLNKDPSFFTSIHTDYVANEGKWIDVQRYNQEKTTPDEWHVYSCEWYEDRLDFYLDGRKYHTYKRLADKYIGTNFNSIYKSLDPSYTGGRLTWPYDKRMHVILSQQIGGGWPDGEAGGNISDADFPLHLEIDYVRIYKRKPLSITAEPENKDTEFIAYFSNENTIKLSENVEWTLTDLYGRQLKSGKGEEIEFSEHAEGYYLLKTVHGTMRIVK